jgi:hypothetical protein
VQGIELSTKMALTVKATQAFANGEMFMPIFGNMPGLSFLGVRRRKVSGRGHNWILSYQSAASNDPNVPSVAEVAYSLVPSYFEAELEAVGPTYQLTVIAPDVPAGDSIGVQEAFFELAGNNLQFDMREHPKALALGPATLKIIDTAISGDTDAARTAAITQVNAAGGDTLALYNLLRQRNGTGAFFKPQYVLRYNRLVSSRATIDVGYSNVGKILTHAQMINDSAPPTGILAAINEAVDGYAPAAVTGYLWGWLKQTPTVQTVAGNKLQISGEYYLEFWSTWLYATV